MRFFSAAPSRQAGERSVDCSGQPTRLRGGFGARGPAGARNPCTRVSSAAHPPRFPRGIGRLRLHRLVPPVRMRGRATRTPLAETSRSAGRIASQPSRRERNPSGRFRQVDAGPVVAGHNRRAIARDQVTRVGIHKRARFGDHIRRRSPDCAVSVGLWCARRARGEGDAEKCSDTLRSQSEIRVKWAPT